MKENKIDSRRIYDGKIMNMRVDSVELENGRRSTREVCEHADGVAILPVSENGEITLVRQFRYPFGIDILEAPAGKVEKGEAHLQCGIRELSEETGLSADSMKYLGFVYPSPGCMTERIHLYIATGLHKGECHPDEGEFLNIEKYSLSDAVDMCDRGIIDDAKTAVLILRAERLMRG